MTTATRPRCECNGTGRRVTNVFGAMPAESSCPQCDGQGTWPRVEWEEGRHFVLIRRHPGDHEGVPLYIDYGSEAAGESAETLREVIALAAERERERYLPDAHRWQMLRHLLIELGCPIVDGCHIPTTVANWVKGLRGGGGFSGVAVADPLKDPKVGDRVVALAQANEHCLRPIVWGVGEVRMVDAAGSVEVKFDCGSGGCFGPGNIYREPRSWVEVAAYLRAVGWITQHSPLPGRSPPYLWRAPDGVSGGDFRSSSPDAPPDAVMAYAAKRGDIHFTCLAV